MFLPPVVFTHIISFLSNHQLCFFLLPMSYLSVGSTLCQQCLSIVGCAHQHLFKYLFVCLNTVRFEATMLLFNHTKFTSFNPFTNTCPALSSFNFNTYATTKTTKQNYKWTKQKSCFGKQLILTTQTKLTSRWFACWSFNKSNIFDCYTQEVKKKQTYLRLILRFFFKNWK